MVPASNCKRVGRDGKWYGDRKASAAVLPKELSTRGLRGEGGRATAWGWRSFRGRSFRDHGAGVPDELRQRLFEAFARGPDDDAPAGLGLGLVLVKTLAEGQGARVTYSDAEGGGAQFTVSFPA